MWIDYLRLNFQKPIPFFEKKMSCLVENSDSIIEDGWTYTKIPLSSWLCVIVSYVYNGQSIPIILYNVFWNNQIYSKYARLDFYGSFFRLIEIWEFPKDFFLSYLNEISDENPTISRIDYCFDLFYKKATSIPSPKRLFSKINESTKIYEIKKGTSLESWSVWSKTAKRYIVRMYDKLLDTKKKWKYFLYGDYLQYETVQRFEVEFWPKFTRGYFLSDIQQLLSKIYSFLWVEKKIFDWLLFYQYDSHFELNDYNKTFFFKQYISKTKVIFNAGLNPYMVAFNGLCVHTQTKHDKKQNINYLKQVIESAKSIDDLKFYF